MELVSTQYAHGYCRVTGLPAFLLQKISGERCDAVWEGISPGHTASVQQSLLHAVKATSLVPLVLGQESFVVVAAQ
jgi:hypothetical protein